MTNDDSIPFRYLDHLIRPTYKPYVLWFPGVFAPENGLMVPEIQK